MKKVLFFAMLLAMVFGSAFAQAENDTVSDPSEATEIAEPAEDEVGSETAENGDAVGQAEDEEGDGELPESAELVAQAEGEEGDGELPESAELVAQAEGEEGELPEDASAIG